MVAAVETAKTTKKAIKLSPKAQKASSPEFWDHFQDEISSVWSAGFSRSTTNHSGELSACSSLQKLPPLHLNLKLV